MSFVVSVLLFIKSRGCDLGPGTLCAPVLCRHAKSLGLDVQGLTVTLDGDSVHISGQARDPDTKIKTILALGNVRGVARVEIAEPDETLPAFYTVVPGDTLVRIADTQLGDGARAADILTANIPLLRAPEDLYPGLVLCLPEAV